MATTAKKQVRVYTQYAFACTTFDGKAIATFTECAAAIAFRTKAYASGAAAMSITAVENGETTVKQSRVDLCGEGGVLYAGKEFVPSLEARRTNIRKISEAFYNEHSDLYIDGVLTSLEDVVALLEHAPTMAWKGKKLSVCGKVIAAKKRKSARIYIDRYAHENEEYSVVAAIGRIAKREIEKHGFTTLCA